MPEAPDISSDDERPPGDQPARRDVFEELAADGEIRSEVFDIARQVIERRVEMRSWLLYSLLVFGITLVLAGVTFFFHHNWQELSDLAKLGVVQAGIGVCLGGAVHMGLDSKPGRLLVVAAGVGVGIFLGVFGMIYQTWAGPWEWLISWTVLMAPLIVFSRSQGGWLVLGGVTTLTLLVSLRRHLGLGPSWAAMYPAAAAACAGAFWAGLRWWRQRGARWLQRFWSEYVWCVAVFGALVAADLIWYGAPSRHLPFLGLAAATPLLWMGRLRQSFDMGLAICAGGAWLVVTAFHVGRWLRDAGLGETGWALAMAVFFGVATALLVWGLRRLADRRDDEREEAR